MSVAPDHGSDPLLSKLRVLYLHGLESGVRGKKMTALRDQFEAVECVDMSRFCNVKALWMLNPFLCVIPIFLGVMVFGGIFISNILNIFVSVAASIEKKSDRVLIAGFVFILMLYCAIKGTILLLRRACSFVYHGCIGLQKKAIEKFKPDVVVGSSFGGAIALFLHLEGVYDGPLLLLAPAHENMARLFGRVGCTILPHVISPIGPCMIVHGQRDKVVPIRSSIALAEVETSAKQANVKLISVVDNHGLSKTCKPKRFRSLVEEAVKWHRDRVQNTGDIK